PIGEDACAGKASPKLPAQHNCSDGPGGHPRRRSAKLARMRSEPMSTLRLAWSATALSFAVSVLAPLPAAARKCPNVMFVVDKSGSMAANPSGGGDPPSKWDLTRQAVSAAVDKYGSRIPFGLEM